MQSTLPEEPLPEVVMPACPIRKLLQGQKVLVTGANSGIGKGIAMALGHAGADVMVNYCSGKDSAHQVAEEVASEVANSTTSAAPRSGWPRTMPTTCMARQGSSMAV